MRAGVLAVTAMVALVVGCGGKSDEDKVRQTAQSFMDALADGDADSGCQQLDKLGLIWIRLGATNPSSGSGLAPEDCAQNFKTVAERGDYSDLQTAEIKRVRIKGDTAYVATDSTSLKQLTLKQHGGDWKVADGGS